MKNQAQIAMIQQPNILSQRHYAMIFRLYSLVFYIVEIYIIDPLITSMGKYDFKGWFKNKF